MSAPATPESTDELPDKRVDPEESLRKAIELHRQGDLAEALVHYKVVLAVYPNQPDALHYLGVLLHQIGESEDAVECIRRSLSMVPDNVHARNNLGNVYREMGRNADAAEAYHEVVALDPNNANAWNNLGVVLTSEGKFEEAEQALQRALEVSPDHADAHFNHGLVLERTDRPDLAADAFDKAVKLKADHVNAYLNLAGAHAQMRRYDLAIADLERLLRFRPDDPRALHLHAAFTGSKRPDRADNGYVSSLFDFYAPDFDGHISRLDYKAPTLVANMVRDIVGDPKADLDILDAGCGTGLSGVAVKPFARRLVGVDLSAGMLRKASQRQDVYQRLVQDELTHFLRNCDEKFDLVVCVDALVYFGELSEVIAATADVLRPAGHFVFTLERLDEPNHSLGFELQKNGRYRQTQEYVRNMIAQCGLALLALRSDDLRTESAAPVRGWVVSARKP